MWVADFEHALTRLEGLGSTRSATRSAPRSASRLRPQPRRGVRRDHGGRPALGAGLAPGSSACPVAVRSVTLSVPDLTRSEAFFAERIRPAALRCRPATPRARGAVGSRRRTDAQRRFTAGSVLVELVHISIRSGGRARRATGSPIRASSTSPSVLGTDAITPNSVDRARAAGARANCRPLHLPRAGVVYVNDPRSVLDRAALDVPPHPTSAGGSRGDLRTAGRRRTRTRSSGPCASPLPCRPYGTSSRTMRPCPIGSASAPSAGRPTALSSGTVAAPSGSWNSPARRITEQVLAYDPPTSYRYRVTKGSPFICHQGEIRLRADDEHTELTWKIRFRPGLPGTGRPLATVLSWPPDAPCAQA